MVNVLAAGAIDINQTITQITTGLTLLGGLVITYIKTRKESEASQLRQAKYENRQLRADTLAQSKWMHAAQIALAKHGIEMPDPPELWSETYDAGEDDVDEVK